MAQTVARVGAGPFGGLPTLVVASLRIPAVPMRNHLHADPPHHRELEEKC